MIWLAKHRTLCTCSCAAKDASKTARSTAVGAWWRTSGSAARRVVQRHILYLGEINDNQRAAWRRSIEVVEGKSGPRRMALFPNDRDAPALDCEVVRINVSEVSLHDPRQWGACWLALNLWGRLDLDRSYEGPSVKRRARCDLQHSCLSSGFLFQASLGSGSASGVDGSERVGAGRAVWRAPNSYPGGRRQHRRSVPRSRLLCGRHVPEVGPIFLVGIFQPQPSTRSHTTRPSAGRVRPVRELEVSGSGDVCAGGHETGAGIAPQRDQQFAGQGPRS